MRDALQDRRGPAIQKRKPIGLPNWVARGKNQEQQLQSPRKANQGKTDSNCLDRRYITPKAEFSHPFLDQAVNAKNDHRDAAIT
jgi:hypothetical protein